LVLVSCKKNNASQEPAASGPAPVLTPFVIDGL
jgi:hypothetical protein